MNKFIIAAFASLLALSAVSVTACPLEEAKKAAAAAEAKAKSGTSETIAPVKPSV